MTAPLFISFCQTYAPSSARLRPSRASTYGASDVAVDALHRRDDTERAKPGNVRRR